MTSSLSSNTYKIESKVWLYPGMASWHFLSIPRVIGSKIKEKHKNQSKGWGSIPVTVKINKTSWKTSIFPDKKSGSYLLPLKVEIRRKEQIVSGDSVEFSIQIDH